jgi:hypothetical protein
MNKFIRNNQFFKIVDLLRYNDEFNNSFKTFESYMEERDRRLGSSQMPTLNRNLSPSRTTNPISQSPTKKVRSFFIPSISYNKFHSVYSIATKWG